MDRRELLGMVGVSALGLTAMSAKADDKSSAGHCCELSQTHKDCLEACNECATACDVTFHHCYMQLAEGKKEHAKALHLAADCAEFCRLSASLIAKQSTLMAHSCRACAEACKNTAAEVDRFDSHEMKDAVKKLRKCEESCRDMVAKMAGHSELRAN